MTDQIAVITLVPRLYDSKLPLTSKWNQSILENGSFDTRQDIYTMIKIPYPTPENQRTIRDL